MPRSPRAGLGTPGSQTSAQMRWVTPTSCLVQGVHCCAWRRTRCGDRRSVSLGWAWGNPCLGCGTTVRIGGVGFRDSALLGLWSVTQPAQSRVPARSTQSSSPYSSSRGHKQKWIVLLHFGLQGRKAEVGGSRAPCTTTHAPPPATSTGRRSPGGSRGCTCGRCRRAVMSRTYRRHMMYTTCGMMQGVGERRRRLAHPELRAPRARRRCDWSSPPAQCRRT